MRNPASDIGRFEALEPEAMLDLALLGPLNITENGTKLELTGPKRRALLILLALNVGTPIGRDRIVEALWPGKLTGREESTLRVHISHVRDVLEPARDGSPKVLVTQGSAYMLASDRVDIDLVLFERLTREAAAFLPTQPDAALPLLNRALGLWRGRPLQDVEYEEFAQDSIRRLEFARIEAIEDRAEALVELGEDTAAIEDLEALVRTDPTKERAVRLLMRALYRNGRHADSLRVARRHARQLAEQGLEPSPQVRLLEDQILQHDPSLLPEETMSPVDIQTGRSVRGYELREESGAGSIGVVYRAFQSSVGREVAIKAIHPHLSQTPEFVRRFAEEARVIAALEHPHIVPLHDFWRDPAGAFLVMRWMDGGSLGEQIESPVAEDELGRIFSQLADALGYAHSAGVVHRDVKPANVLFDSSGNAYLCDFGLAVTGIDTGADTEQRLATIEPVYASPELLSGESPSISSDIYALGVLLAETATGRPFKAGDTPLKGDLLEVVLVSTATNPADRYPDMSAFRSALLEAVGTTMAPAPRRVRRNPYKGLASFDEGDRADFYGRDGIVETLLDMVASNGLTAIIGASGSGKSSVVRAGLIPELRDGALPGSDEWATVQMVPGTDPFDEFHVGIRSAAVGSSSTASDDRSRELRNAFNDALDGPNNRALLFVDQFEEVFSSQVDERTRQRFLDNLVDLARDPHHRVRVVLALRADFSDRPLGHPHFGDLMSRASFLLAPMLPEQVEDVIRQPAARVGVQVEPGFIAEVVRDVATAPAYLPLLQYVLSELFERRTEDRLTVQAYRSLGGVEGVLERRAEATFFELDAPAQKASRQLFLRMIHLGDHGEETRRRLALTELAGLGGRAEVDHALEAFSGARLLTYDRDPISRTPTVEVAHEAVIQRWTRYRIWIDEARADLLAHRRLAAAAATWAASDEDPSYLLTGGPLATALDVASSDRIKLNELELRLVTESQLTADAARSAEEERRRHEKLVEHRARRRLAVGIGAAAVAVLVGILAVFALVQRQRADDLAAVQERQNTSRELAAASLANLDSADPELSLLLAVEAADLSLDAEEQILPEVVEALHRAVINPRPTLTIEGGSSQEGGQIIKYSRGGLRLGMVTRDGGAAVVDPDTGDILGRIAPIAEPAFGIDFHLNGRLVLTTHADGVRQWDWKTGTKEVEFLSGVTVSTAVYSHDGRFVAIGRNDGSITVLRASSGETVAELAGHVGRVNAIDFDPTNNLLVSGGNDAKVFVWDIASEELTVSARIPTISQPVVHLAWLPSPFFGAAVVTTRQAETFIFDTKTGERLNSYGNGQNFNSAIAFETTGSLVVAAGADGVARIYGSYVGGEELIQLSSGGVPLRDAEFEPSSFTVATAGADGKVRIWENILGSELPIRVTPTLYPTLMASEDGSRYTISSSFLWLGVPPVIPATMNVIETATGETLLSRPMPRGQVGIGPAALSRDGSMTAFAGPDGDIQIVDIATDSTITIPDTAGWTAALDFNNDGTLLAGASTGGPIGVWDAATGDTVAVLVGHGDREPINASTPSDQEEGVAVSYTAKRVNAVMWHPDGDGLVSAGYDGTIRVWDLASSEGQVLHTFDFEGESAAYSPDGSQLVASDSIGTLVDIDPDSGEVLRTLEGPGGGVALVFSPDGRYLAGVGLPGAVLWDLSTHRIVRRFQGNIFAPTNAVFINDGGDILIASGEGMIRRYLTDPLDLVELARSEATRGLTEAECQLYLRKSCEA